MPQDVIFEVSWKYGEAAVNLLAVFFFETQSHRLSTQTTCSTPILTPNFLSLLTITETKKLPEDTHKQLLQLQCSSAKSRKAIYL